MRPIFNFFLTLLVTNAYDNAIIAMQNRQATTNEKQNLLVQKLREGRKKYPDYLAITELLLDSEVDVNKPDLRGKICATYRL